MAERRRRYLRDAELLLRELNDGEVLRWRVPFQCRPLMLHKGFPMTPTLPIEPETVAALVERLGGISPARILMQPTPGTATPPDVLSAFHRPTSVCAN